MRKKLLLSISIVLLFTFNIQAESDVNLPALPIDSTIELTDKKNDSDVSFWQKVKSFFGVGNEEKIENVSETDAQEDNNSDTNLLANDIIPAPVESLEDGPSIVQSDKPIPAKDFNSTSQEGVNPSESSDLSIPKGFDDENEALKLPSGFSENTIESKEMALMPEKMDEPINSKNIPTILAEKNNKLSDDPKQKIEDSAEALKLPGGFNDVEKPVSLTEEGAKSKIKSGKEETSEGMKVEIPISPSPVMEDDPTNNTKDDGQIMLPGTDASEELAKTESIVKEALPIPAYASTPEIPKEQKQVFLSLQKLLKARNQTGSNCQKLRKKILL